MERTESTGTLWPVAGPNYTVDASDNYRNIPKHRRAAIYCVLVLCLTFAAGAVGSTGPGIALKIGAQTLDHPVDGDETTRARYELELSSARFADDLLDLSLIFGGSSLGTVSDDYAYWDGDVFVEESYEDDLSVIDIRLAARLYPLRNRRGIQPYLGAGVGYFWFLDSWEDRYAETFEDPGDPGTWYTVSAKDDDRETLADGFFPFVMAGVNVPITENAELLFEFQFDFEKEDGGFDLGGPIYMAGARFRF